MIYLQLRVYQIVLFFDFYFLYGTIGTVYLLSFRIFLICSYLHIISFIFGEFSYGGTGLGKVYSLH